MRAEHFMAKNLDSRFQSGKPLNLDKNQVLIEKTGIKMIKKRGSTYGKAIRYL